MWLWKRRYPGLLPCFIHGIEERGWEEARKGDWKRVDRGVGGEKGWGLAGGVIMKARWRKYFRTMSNITNITICYVGNA